MINPQNSPFGSTIVCNSSNVDSELKRGNEFQVFGWNKEHVCIHVNGCARWFKSVHFDRKKSEADLKAEENFRHHQTGGDLGPTGHGDAPDVDTTQAKIEFEDDLNGKSPKAKVEKEVVLKPKKGSK